MGEEWQSRETGRVSVCRSHSEDEVSRVDSGYLHSTHFIVLPLDIFFINKDIQANESRGDYNRRFSSMLRCNTKPFLMYAEL
jgi:hypothetical protein